MGQGGLSKRSNVKMSKEWPIHQPTHIPHIGEGVSTNHKYSNRIQLPRLDQDLFYFYWFDITLPINPPVHPPIGGNVFTNQKSSNQI